MTNNKTTIRLKSSNLHNIKDKRDNENNYLN